MLPADADGWSWWRGRGPTGGNRPSPGSESMAETTADKGEGNTGAGSPRPECGRAEVPTSRRPGSGRTAGRGALPGKSRLVPLRGPEAKRRFTSGGSNQNFSLGQKKKNYKYIVPLKLQQQTEMKTVFFLFSSRSAVMRAGRRRLWRRCWRASERSARSCREGQRLHGITTSWYTTSSICNTLGAQQAPGWSGSHVLVKLDFFFFFNSKLGQADRCCCVPLSAASQARCQQQHAPVTHVTVLLFTQVFCLTGVHDALPLADAPPSGAAHLLWRAAHKDVLCADRCAARRPPNKSN